ncbi:MAG: MBL fold metallo-hydrolase [Bdellovibrionaceae bacterium]|nr:MBL fold metallo-hydrolase [Bdellovibrionales bacterium]MCB9082741.1 MBL fold metallo-hydrolase [Pseudobdellovibrionaceae bacterium]
MSRKLLLQFLGAAGTVTGSRTVVRYGDYRILVDCGLYQGPKEIRQLNWDPFPEVEKLDAVVLTHAHIDHSGYLPKLSKEGFNGPVYCSKATQDLCDIMLMDSAHLQEEDARFANKSRHSRHYPALPLYTTPDAIRVLKQFESIPMDEWKELVPGLSLRMIRAGHILGSAIVQFSYEGSHDSRLLTFSGDLGNGRSHILKPPVMISETDYLVMESTYGDRVQPREGQLKPLGEIIRKVTGRGGTLVIPAFTVGRTQELLYLIRQLESQNLIPLLPVYVDSPMALDATQVYANHSEELKLAVVDGELQSPVCTSSYTAVKSADDSMLLCMDDSPKIVISAAGMLTGGRILHHLKAKLPDPKSGVLFVGYQAEGTKGLLLKQGLTDIRIHHQPVTVEAEIMAMDTFSAHADSNDIMDWLRNFKKPPRGVFLNHGEPNALRALKYRISNEFEWKVMIPQLGDEVLINGG